MKILLVSNDPNQAKEISNALETLSIGISIASYNFNDDVLEYIEASQYDILLVDCSISLYDKCPEIIKASRKAKGHLIGILLLIESDNTIWLNKFADLDIDHYMKKPLDRNEFKFVVQMMYRKIHRRRQQIEATQNIELRLRRYEERYRTVIDNIADSIVMINQDGNIVFVNNTFCILSGRTRPSLLKMKFVDIVHQDFKSKVEKDFHQKMLKNKPNGERFEFTGIKPDGTQFMGELAPVYLENVEGKKILAIIRDVTGEYKTEEVVREIVKLRLKHNKVLKEKTLSYGGSLGTA